MITLSANAPRIRMEAEGEIFITIGTEIDQALMMKETQETKEMITDPEDIPLVTVTITIMKIIMVKTPIEGVTVIPACLITIMRVIERLMWVKAN